MSHQTFELSGLTWILFRLGVDSKAHLNKPIHEACKTGNTELVKTLLLNNGSSFNVPSIGNLFSSLRDLFSRYSDNVDQKEGPRDGRGNKMDVDILDLSGYAPLHYAAKEGHREIVELLLDYGANMEIVDSNGLTPLLLAINSVKSDVVKLLLKKGAKRMEKDMNLNRLLLLAVRYGYYEKTLLALMCGAWVNFVDSTGNSALTYAITVKRKLNIVKLLLLNGASVTFRDRQNQTALHLAVERGEFEIARLLFRAHPYRPLDLKVSLLFFFCFFSNLFFFGLIFFSQGKEMKG